MGAPNYSIENVGLKGGEHLTFVERGQDNPLSSFSTHRCPTCYCNLLLLFYFSTILISASDS